MGLIYSAFMEAVAVTAAQDAFTLVAPSDAAVKILSAHLGQDSDPGDAQAENLRLNLVRYGTVGSGGSGATESPHAVGYPAAGAAVTINNTTQGTTAVQLRSYTFNVQIGWDFEPTDREVIDVSPSGIFAIDLAAAPADSLTMSGFISWEEIGG